MPAETKNIYNLADFLITPSATTQQSQPHTAPAHLSNADIVAEVQNIARNIKPYITPDLSGYKVFRQKEHLSDKRHAKADLFIDHDVYDKFLRNMLQEYLIIAIAFLRRIYSMHSAKIICGNVSPSSFIFDRVETKVYRDDLHVVFSDKAAVRAEEHSGIDMIFVKTKLRSVLNNKYLAPELIESVTIYAMKQRLHDLKIEAEHRNLLLGDSDLIERALKDLHQVSVKYTDKAESYSVGYVLIELLSNMLVKLVQLNTPDVYNFNYPKPDPKMLADANLLLPDQFNNPGELKLLKLLNESIAIIYGLMEPQISKRRTIKGAIFKLKSVLRRLMEEPPGVMNDTSGTILDALRSRRGKP